mgnify:CR=1 FL=1
MKQIYLKQAERSIRLQFPDYSETKVKLMAQSAYRAKFAKEKRIKTTAFIENQNKSILIF